MSDSQSLNPLVFLPFPLWMQRFLMLDVVWSPLLNLVRDKFDLDLPPTKVQASHLESEAALYASS